MYDICHCGHRFTRRILAPEMTRKRRIGIIVYDGVQSLDIVGPADAFAAATVTEKGRTVQAYEITLIGLTAKPVRSEAGIVFQPDVTIHNSPQVDTLIIPGGKGLRTNQELQSRVTRYVRDQAKRVRRVVAVCTGIYGIAASGLLDGRRVTTHWRFAEDLATRFPKLNVEADRLFLKQGSLYSSAGITAGIDLSLALIEEDLGPRAALEVARDLVVYLKRSGGQEQYSRPLQFQSLASDRLADVVAWMVNNLSGDLDTGCLAAKANLCPRHFTRVFRRSFGRTPRDFVEKLRLGEARRLLGEHGRRVEQVAEEVGFASADSFRRAFERRFGVAPSHYRGRFQTGRLLDL